MSILYLVPVIFIFALVVPTSWVMVRGWWHWHGRRRVNCPHWAGSTMVELGACRAAWEEAWGNSAKRVVHCSNWPELRDCDQECVKQVAPR